MKHINKPAFILCIILTGTHASAQRNNTKIDLSRTENLQSVNRTTSSTKGMQDEDVIHLDAGDGPGVVWITGISFRKGVVEFDVKGRNVMQQSFVGLAFHGANDSTYEAVYFRPFNFQADDAVRRSHAVQYISLPKYDWSYLRETYPDKYESTLHSPVSPDSRFHVKIEVSNKAIKVFVNTDKEPSLVISPLTHQPHSRLGFWVGNSSDGDFSNLNVHSVK